MFRIPRRARLAIVCAGVFAATLAADVQASDRSTLATGKIAYQKNRAVGQINPDGTGKTVLYKHQGYRQCCMDWSPDGSQLLVIDYSNKNFSKQALLALGQENLVFAHQRFNVFDATWSPDGDWVGFTAHGEGREGLWVVDEHGNDREQVYQQEVFGPLQWSHDSMNLAFQHYAKKGRGVIGYYSRLTHEVYDLTIKAYDAYEPRWSPVENKLYFLNLQEGGEFGNFVLYRMNADGTDIEQLTGDDENVYGYAISPDGSTIAAIICCSDEEGLTEVVYVMDIDGNNRVQVDTDGTAGGVSGYLILHEWAPDGSVFIYEKSRSNAVSFAVLENALYSAMADGTGATQLVDEEGLSFEDWAPDSSAFATCDFDDAQLLLGVYDFAAGEHSTLTNGCSASWGT